jgi:hypothetical protein
MPENDTYILYTTSAIYYYVDGNLIMKVDAT